ncbi:hypothetical protein P692DRAFT_20100112 [Suillus brevipes Sb2]|nr:hypothetical protein P692DRAFT_20100112 [Suillus brevipes Sb2]
MPMYSWESICSTSKNVCSRLPAVGLVASTKWTLTFHHSNFKHIAHFSITIEGGNGASTHDFISQSHDNLCSLVMKTQSGNFQKMSSPSVT